MSLPTKILAAPGVRDLPEPPAHTWRLVGPGVVSLPEPLKVRGLRAGVLVFSFAFFGVLPVLTIEEQLGKLFS